MDRSTMFLLGAGASHKAGISGIESMTDSFLDDLYLLVQSYAWDFHEKAGLLTIEKVETDYFGPDAEEVVKLLKKDIMRKKSRFDIELLLEALNNLESKEHILYSVLTYPKKYKKYDKQYKHLKNILIKFIRNKCENMLSVNYLYPLRAFSSDAPLDIFTLNYDGTIEKMCKEYDIEYADGFKEEWNTDYFLDENIDIRLYKLHGSLYWFKTEKGKYIKLPIKNIEVEKLTYFMDEKISETLLWPMITKDYSTGPFPWLMEELRKKLRTYELCIVLGYSFRDDYIKQMVLDEMQNNSELWLFIVDHHASEIKKLLCKNRDYLKDRIITANEDIEDMLLNRILIEKQRNVFGARNQEEQYKKGLILSKNIQASHWRSVVNIYRLIPHLDRIRNIARNIFDTYQSETEQVPSLQWYLFDLALRFGIESYLNGDNSESKYWLNIFNECSIVLDWVMSRGVSKDHELISPRELPLWVRGVNPDHYSLQFSMLNDMIDTLGKCMQMLDREKELQKIITNYIKAMEIYTKNLDDESINREVVISNLRDNGLVWSHLTSLLIFKMENKEGIDSPTGVEGV